MPIVIDRCPSCSGPLAVRALHCARCDLELRGEFAAQGGGPFGHLSTDQQAFLRLFVTSRGNLSEVERALGVSYPTVRAKLDDLIEAVAGGVSDRTADTGAAREGRDGRDGRDARAASPGRREILERIADGRLSADEGLALLRRLRG